jgi:hypothetical protein
MTERRLYVCSGSARWLTTVLSAAKDEFVVKAVEHPLSDPRCRAELGEPPARGLLLVDATLAPDVEKSIPCLREAGWEYVVVVAAKPDYKQARAVLRDAGGFDYWSKTYDSRILRADLMRCWEEMTAEGEETSQDGRAVWPAGPSGS